MKITIKIDPAKTRKRVPPCGGAMATKKGRGSYIRKDKRNRKWGE